jgi:glycogen operon protein
MTSPVLKGQPYPLGATPQADGVNFALFTKSATVVELVLFDRDEDVRPARVIRLEPLQHKTFYYWHCLVPGLKAGQLYGWRVHGPYQPERGLRFDNAKVLLDPYARSVMVGPGYDREASKQAGDNSAFCMKSVVVDLRGYDWEDDQHPRHARADTVIYEMHVGAFTRNANCLLPDAVRGTYAGVVAKIPYLKSLGVTTLELLPVQQFDAQEGPKGLTNLWGYAPVAFSAPHRGYTQNPADVLAPVREFRDMVKALHKAGIEVILDVVYNHTAEADLEGPTLSLRGLEAQAYYLLDKDGDFSNFTGCGNTINGNHSIVRRLIMDSLRFWVQGMHVDGFRFDLASVLARDESGQPVANPPILWEIESDPVLAGSRIIAEAWDAAGLYQVGSFIGDRWAETNGRFRDDVRRFVRGDSHTVDALASRVAGSPDVFQREGRDPTRSINFVTCHDGFTLHDLVSYAHKHNDANNQDSKDGANENFSDNHGEEGATDDPVVLARRNRQARNLETVMFFSHGTPMMLMGDEVLRTQRGNNNTYCQDNPVGWMDWDDLERHGGMFRFVQGLIRLRKGLTCLSSEVFWTREEPTEAIPSLRLHGIQLGRPDRTDHSHTLAWEVCWPHHGEHFHLMANAWREPLAFALPPALTGRRWRKVVDTAEASPMDAPDAGKAPTVPSTSMQVDARSVVVVQAL